MVSKAPTVDEYLQDQEPERRAALEKLRAVIVKNLPAGFEETMQYGMPSYVVPHSLYPDGYHCKPTDALPFLSFNGQKNFIALYHMFIYADQEIHDWFVSAYNKVVPSKLDMGKSCIRFKKMDQIPYELIGQLAGKITPDQWITVYEDKYKPKRIK